MSVWLTFPYFFLVSMGALQSIPAELIEAARVDGGGPWQVFRRVTLPLLLVAVAPLMIASFAFNFNNFNNIYLLTGGGPANRLVCRGRDGHPDQLHVQARLRSGKGNDYGLASAIAIVIFFIVATISAIAFSHTKALEEIAMSTLETQPPTSRRRRAPPRSRRRRARKLRDTWWRHARRRSSRWSSRCSRSSTSSRPRSTPTPRCRARA